MPALAVRILELVAAHGEVTVGGVIAVTGAPRGTVKKWLGELTAAGQLRLVGEGRGARDVVGDKQFPPQHS
jgi:DNA-binding IclR family transcriptional regulator